MLTRPKHRQLVIDPGNYGLDQGHVDWLRTRLGESASVDDVFELARDTSLSETERRIVAGLERSVLGDLRIAPGVAFGADGKEPIDARKIWTLRGARVPSTAKTEDGRFKEAMEPYLIGQKGMLRDFEKFRTACNGLTGRTPPMMVLGGDAGHGKDQALDGFAQAMFGEDARVITVDLTNVTDAMVDELFGEGGRSGELSTWALQEVEDYKKGVVRLTGLDNLKDRAPQIAQKLVEQMGTQRGEQGHAWVPFILDFDVAPKTNLRTMVTDALGPAAARMRSAQGEAQHLGEEAMLQYVDALLPELLAQPGLSKLRLEFDQDARQVLGKVLATSHEPLYELEPRLQTLVLSQFDSHQSVAEDAVMRVHLMPEMKADDIALDRAIAAYQKPDADIFMLPEMFTVDEEGRVADPDAHQHLLERTEDLVDEALQTANQIYAVAERIAPEYGDMANLISATNGVEERLRGVARALSDDALFGSDTGAALLGAVGAAESALAELASAGAGRLKNLGLSMGAPTAVALHKALEAARLIARAPELSDGENADGAALETFSGHVRMASQAIRAVGQRLHDENRAVLEGSVIRILGSLAKTVGAAFETAQVSARQGVDPLIAPSDAKEIIDLVEVAKGMVVPVEDSRILSPIASQSKVLLDEGRREEVTEVLDRIAALAGDLGGLTQATRRSLLEARAEEIKDSPALRRKMAKRIIRTANGATEVDARVLAAELVKLPLRVLKRLERNQIPVTAIRGKLTDYRTEIPKDTRPPGYPEGKTYDDVLAIFCQNGDDGEVVVVTKEQNGNVVIPGLDGKRGSNPVLHEALHAFDKGSVFSGSGEFAAAREADYHSLDEYEKQPVEDDGFDRGAAETFAITGERLYGGDEGVRSERPNLVEYLDDITSDPDEEGGA